MESGTPVASVYVNVIQKTLPYKRKGTINQKGEPSTKLLGGGGG